MYGEAGGRQGARTEPGDKAVSRPRQILKTRDTGYFKYHICVHKLTVYETCKRVTDTLLGANSTIEGPLRSDAPVKRKCTTLLPDHGNFVCHIAELYFSCNFD